MVAMMLAAMPSIAMYVNGKAVNAIIAKQPNSMPITEWIYVIVQVSNMLCAAAACRLRECSLQQADVMMSALLFADRDNLAVG